jgi:hypothetical protein
MVVFGKPRALALLICALMIGLYGIGSHPVPAQAQLEITATVDTDRLLIRSAPSTRGTVLGELTRGQTIKLVARAPYIGWAYGTAETGALGWVSTNFIVIPETANLRDLPVLDGSAPTNPAGGQPSAPAAPGAPAPTAAPPANSSDAGGTSGGSQPPAAPPPPPSAANIRGFELGGQVNALTGPTIAAMRRAGMTWVKRQAQAGDGAGFAFINEAKANGFRILLSVIGDKEAVLTPGGQDAYAGYVASLAAAGADAIEIWNEQNLDREWKQGFIDPNLYTSLLAKSYVAIKGANPGTLVISGAPAPTGAEGAFGLDRVWNDDRYVAGMARAGAARYMDCVGLHYNEGIVSPNQRSGDPRGDNYPTRYYDGQVARGLNPFGGKRGCFTELGYLSPEGYGPLPGGFAWASKTTVAQQAQWLAEAASRAANSGRIRLMIVFNVDFTLYGDDPQGGYAIIRPDGSCPACETLGRVMGVR